MSFNTRTRKAIGVVGSFALLITSACSGPGPIGSVRTLRYMAYPTAPDATTNLNADRAVISTRLRLLGDSDPAVTIAGGHLRVQVPSNLPRLARIGIFSTASTAFQPIGCGAPPFSGVESPHLVFPECGESYILSPLTLEATGSTLSPDQSLSSVPSATTSSYIVGDPVVLAARNLLWPSNWPRFSRVQLGPSLLTSADVSAARPVQLAGGWGIRITFSARGSGLWRLTAQDPLPRLIAIDMDANIVATDESPTPGTVVFGGSMSRNEANLVFALLLSGPLNAPLHAVPPGGKQ